MDFPHAVVWADNERLLDTCDAIALTIKCYYEEYEPGFIVQATYEANAGPKSPILVHKPHPVPEGYSTEPKP